VLVGYLWSDPFFAANHDQGVEFLMVNQGPIRRIDLMLGQSWWLEIRLDDSASSATRGERVAQVWAGTFDFPVLVEVLSGMASGKGRSKENAVVFLVGSGGRIWSSSPSKASRSSVMSDGMITSPPATRRRTSSKGWIAAGSS
jgi:hypothetical protein